MEHVGSNEKTYSVVTSNDELDEGVDDVGTLICNLNIFYDNSPTPYQLMIQFVVTRVLLCSFRLRWCYYNTKFE